MQGRGTKSKSKDKNWEDHFVVVQDSTVMKEQTNQLLKIIKAVAMFFFGTVADTIKTVVLIITFVWALKKGHLNLWCPIAGLVFVFTHLGGERKKGELSAYSVFNKNFERPIGQFVSSFGLAKVQRKRPKRIMKTEKELAMGKDSYFAKKNKYANKPCYCGSKHKYKKCCLPQDFQEYYGQLKSQREEMKKNL